jgi:hypothetical protein
LDYEVLAEEGVQKEIDEEPSKETFRDCEFANVVVIDNDGSLVLDQHIISLDAFVGFLDCNFICCNCGESKSVIQHQLVSITSSINCFCVI